MDADPLIEVRGVGRFYGNTIGLRGADLQVRAGEFVALTGPSGAGKSTLLFLLAGLDAPDAGVVLVAGRDLADWSDGQRSALRLRAVGFVFQDAKLLPELTVRQNVALPLEHVGISRGEVRRRTDEILQRLGISELATRSPGTLSGGEQQRVALARALAPSPRILLADEPTGNLDRSAGAEILRLLAEETAERGVTIVLATHDPAAAACARRVVALHDGVIQEERSREGDPPQSSSPIWAPDVERPPVRWSMALPYRHVRARARQMALSVVAVGLGVALVVAIELMNGAVLSSFLDTADAVAGRASLTISAGPGLYFPEATAAEVGRVTGVKLAVPLVRAVAFPDDGSGEMLTVHGVDLTHDAAVRLYHAAGEGKGDTVIDDLLEFINSPDAIVLGEEFARRRGLHVGDGIRLVTPYGVQSFTVRGLLEAQGLARTLGGRLVVMDLFAAERAFAAEGQVSQIDVVVAPGADVDVVRQAIAAVLPAGLAVEEPELRKGVIRKTIGGFQFMIAAFGLLAVLAGFVICYSRLSAVFEARTWQVGLLRAVGLSRTAVFAELLKESLLLGLVGTLLGIGLGTIIGRYGLPVLAATTALAFRMPVPAAEPPGLGWEAVWTGATVGLVAALLAAVVPALRLARKQPVAALRLRGREMPPARIGIAWLVRPLAVLVLIAASVFGQLRWQQTALGHVTTALLAIAVLVTATPAVAVGGRLLGAVWARLFGPTGRFAARHVEWQPRRSALTVATIGLGLGAVLLFSILGWSFERTLVDRLDERIRADLIVSSGLFSGGYREAPLVESVVAQISRIPGVNLVMGEQQTDVRYRNGEIVMLNAYDEECFLDQTMCDWRLGPQEAGNLPVVANGQGVLVSKSFAHHYDVGPGDFIDIPTPNGLLRILVVGTTSGQSMDAIILARSLYKREWSDPLVYLTYVRIAEGASSKAIRNDLARTLGQTHRLNIRSRSDLLDYFGGEAHKAFSLLYLMEGMIFLLVVVAIGDTLAASVNERGRRFATLRALGMPKANVFQLVMLEGATIGILGLSLAVAVGAALGLFWVSVQFPALLGWRLDVHVPYAFAIGAGALTLLLCLTGSLLPSRRASRLPVARALRND